MIGQPDLCGALPQVAETPVAEARLQPVTRMPKLPCCEHGYMAGPDLPDVECCICSRSFCRTALADDGLFIRLHLFVESERSAWFREHPQPNPFEVDA